MPDCSTLTGFIICHLIYDLSGVVLYVLISLVLIAVGALGLAGKAIMNRVTGMDKYDREDDFDAQ